MWKLRLQQLNREFGRIMWDIYKCIIYEVYEIWTLLTPSESFVVLQSFSIKNRCFIFLCVSINRRYNPLSLDLTLKVLLRYRKRCKRTKNHLQTISAHNIMCYFYISILFPVGMDTKAVEIWFIQNWGKSKIIIFNEAYFEQDFLNVFSLQKLKSSLSFS